MEKLSELPPAALITFGATLAVIFAVRYLGLVSGGRQVLDAKPGAAQVAAVIVDPTALNHATAALKDHTVVMREVLESAQGMSRNLGHLGTELDRIREELRIQREISRRN